METILPILLTTLTAALLIMLWRSLKTRQQSQTIISELENQLSKCQSELDFATRQTAEQCRQADLMSTRLAQTESLLASERQTTAILKTRIEIAETQQTENARILQSQFKNLASEILASNSRQFKEQNEQRLSEILAPLRDNLEQFRKTVTDTYSNEARERFSLSQRLRELIDLNQSISREAKELSGALRGDSKVQGDWGEMVLESILQRSGLQRDREYRVQITTDDTGTTLRDDQGRHLRPDVAVDYPDGRCIVIDSKVSLTAFVELVNAETDQARQIWGERHVKSVKAHIDELAHKRYQEFVGSGARLDFVMMFIPNEPAYIAAMRLQPTLWQEAYDKSVLIVSPTHLISALRMIEQLWARDRQSRNAMEIADEAAKMYDKFAAFITDMDKIEKSLESTRKAYADAMTKLSRGRGNLLSRAERLRQLGVKASKLIARQSDADADPDADPPALTD